MKKRIIIILVCLFGIAAGITIWAIVSSQQPVVEQQKAATEQEKILVIANNDAAATNYQLTASSISIEKVVGEWVYARITYRSSVSGTDTTYPVVLLKDSGGDYSIVVGFNDSTLPADLIERSIPQVIIDAIQLAKPVPTEMEDKYE